MRSLHTLSACLILAICLYPGYAHTRQSTQVAFSPSGQSVELVQNTIALAEKSIELAAYSFSSQKVADALIEAHRRGVVIRVVLDKSHAARHYRAVEAMREAGIAVRINYNYAIMHDKFLIIDSKTVETGSFNYTVNAERRNAENVIVISNNKKLAQQYIDNWQKLWNEAAEMR